MEKGALIGRGLNAEVFVWGNGRVLKLFYPWVQPQKIEREFSATRAVWAAGLPAPNAFEQTEVEGRRGIVLERIDGIPMFSQFRAAPWLMFRGARQSAALHAQLHSVKAPAELPLQRDQMRRWLMQAPDLPEPVRAAAVRQLERSTDGSSLCHGDFHPANILLCSKGPVIIDWSEATRGDPIADLARTRHLIRNAPVPEETPRLLRWLVNSSRHLLERVYLREYFRCRPGREDELDAWTPVQAAATAAWGAAFRLRSADLSRPASLR